MRRKSPVGRLADRLRLIPPEGAWAAMAVLSAIMAWANIQFPSAGLAPFYLPVLCGACWILGFRKGLIMALVAATLGAIASQSQTASLPPLALATRVAIWSATCLAIARLVSSFRDAFDEQHHLAVRDRMTGALNGEIFQEQLIEILSRARRSNETLLLMVLDLDDFRELNNRYGHPAGDAVLRLLAGAARQLLAQDEMFGRLGGDEFALLLRVSGPMDAPARARRVYASLSAALDETPYPATCSIGAVIVPPDAIGDYASLMNAVDGTMYVAKRGGKNMIEIITLNAPPGPKLRHAARLRARA